MITDCLNSIVGLILDPCVRFGLSMLVPPSYMLEYICGFMQVDGWFPV